MKKTTLVLNFAFAVTLAQAQTAVQEWVQRYNGPGNVDDQPIAVVVNSIGDLVVTGWSHGDATYADYATLKYSSSGVPLWTNRYNGTGSDHDQANTVIMDATGNVIVTGWSWDWESDLDFATIAYSSSGVPLWTNRYNGTSNSTDAAFALAVDGSGNVFVGGSSVGDGSDSDIVTISYSTSGLPRWINRFNGPGNGYDKVFAAALDTNGNFFVVGSSVGIGSSDDYVTIAYSNGGVPLWTNRYNGPANGSDVAGAVGVDKSGNVFITGWSAGSGSFDDFVTIAYSNGGTPIWTNRYNGPANGLDRAIAATVDANGSVFVTGRSIGIGSSNDIVTIAYSGTGTPLWTNRYNGPANGDDRASGIAVDQSGNVFVVGRSAGSGSGFDYVTLGYSGAGVPLWTNRYNGPGNGTDQAAAVAVDGSGNVFVTGYSSNGTNYDYATIKYSILQPIPLAIQAMNNEVVLSWTNAAFGLQSAPAVTGTFTNLAGATSPYTNPLTAPQQFFRLIGN